MGNVLDLSSARASHGGAQREKSGTQATIDHETRHSIVKKMWIHETLRLSIRDRHKIKKNDINLLNWRKTDAQCNISVDDPRRPRNDGQ